MTLILKHTLNSLGKNKSQIIIILFTVVIVSTMIFAAFFINDIFFNIISINYERVASDADMVVGGYFGDADTYSQRQLENLLDMNDVDYIDYFLRQSAVINLDKDSSVILMEGTNLKEYLNRNQIPFVQKFDQQAEHPQAIISENFAKNKDIKIGETIEITMLSLTCKLTVTHIASNSGIFSVSAVNNILCDISAMTPISLANSTYIKFKDKAMYEKYEPIIKKALPNINVAAAFPTEDRTRLANQNTMMFTVALVFIVGLMMMIAYGSYMIIIKNRMNELALFKSVGATPKQTVMLLLSEVTIYGIIGSIIGLMLARIAVGAMIKILMPNVQGVVTYEFWKFLCAFILSVAVSVGSALSPIIKISQKSIRDITTSSMKLAPKGNWVMALVALVVIIAMMVLLNFVNIVVITIVSAILIVISLAVFVNKILPYVINFSSKSVSKMKKSGEVKLAAKSIKNNGQVHGIATLVSIIIVFSFLVLTVLNFIQSIVTESNTRFNADFVAMTEYLGDVDEHETLGRQFLAKGAKNYFFYASVSVFLSENEGFTCYGVNNGDAIKNMVNTKVSAEVMKKFNETSNSIILNYQLAKRYNIKIGDKISLMTAVLQSDGNVFKPLLNDFVVVGIDMTLTEWDDVSFVNINNLKTADTQIFHDITYMLEGSESDFAKIRSAMDDYNFSGSLFLQFDEWAFSSSQNFQNANLILKVLQIAVSAIALLGIFDMCYVTFYDRKSELNVYQLSGMDSKKKFNLFLYEALIISMTSILIGTFSSLIINRFVPIVATLVGRFKLVPYIPLSIFIVDIIICLFFAIIWVSFARKKVKSEER